jgi:uncharacterized protein (DUF1501 family)
MLRVPGPPIRLCEGVTRRDLLRVGTLGAVGLSLPKLFQLQDARGESSTPRADACILLFLWGAPSQFETLDPKPEAPSGIRGEFGVTRTGLPGVLFGEHIPQLAARTDRFAVVRTCAQTSTHHQSAGYEALTGYPPSKDAVALTATPADHPNLGSVVARFAPGNASGLRFVTLPQLISDVGNLTPGQFAGYLGRQCDPFALTKDPNAADFDARDLLLASDVSSTRLGDRRSLLHRVDQQRRELDRVAGVQSLDVYQDRACRLLTSPLVRHAFNLGRESVAVRERYGRNTFGQSCLLARRLVEAGVKLVTVYGACNGKTPQDAWDTHENNFGKLKNELLPPMDQATSALIDDLHDRGLAESMLLLWMGEFGRTPRINAKAGRDHWQHSYSILLSGGGVRPGQVYGQSDRHGAYPVHGRVFTPADITATVYDCLGINPRTTVVDPQGRPLRLTEGTPMRELFT